MGKNIEYKYNNFLKGKKVVLVGPAWSTKHTNKRKKIYSYDVIVRMNAGFIVSEKKQKDIGRKTDILYCSLSKWFFRNNIFTCSEFKKSDIKWIVGTGNHKATLLNHTLSKINKKIFVRMVNKKLYKKIISMVGTKRKITSGIVTIIDLLQSDISELYVTGFTFYNIFSSEKIKKYYYKNYMPGYMERVGTPYAAHNMHKEFALFKEITKKDKRIVCDETLQEIIRNN